MTDSSTRQGFLPMRLYNSSISDATPVRYPAGVQGPLPVTRWEVLTQTANQCQATAAALNLPLLPANTLVAQRFRQITDYLGIVR